RPGKMELLCGWRKSDACMNLFFCFLQYFFINNIFTRELRKNYISAKKAIFVPIDSIHTAGCKPFFSITTLR
ncbi:MAG TPA: hypothetical protein PK167_14000, partial [Prolixibacteraceae bacterium]|nr:hypothetical protein [Prolixibacteraceae bacterium]